MGGLTEKESQGWMDGDYLVVPLAFHFKGGGQKFKHAVIFCDCPAHAFLGSRASAIE